MNKLINRVTELLEQSGIQHEVTGNLIQTRLCNIEVWGREVTLNEEPIMLEDLIDEVQRIN